MNAQTQLVRLLRRLAALCLLAAFAAAGDVMPDGGGNYGDDNAGDGARIKDIASVVGVRSNQLVGYGLVVGLDGTGDNTSNTRFTAQSMANMLRQLGVALPPNVQIRPKNVAAVLVTATLPPFAKQGQTIDVTVSSMGNASSLRGGALLMTPLKGADGEIYALAQGNMIVGGFGVKGADGSKITVNVPSSGRIPNGANVERTVESPFTEGGDLVLNLHDQDFTTAHADGAGHQRPYGAQGGLADRRRIRPRHDAGRPRQIGSASFPWSRTSHSIQGTPRLGWSSMPVREPW